VKAYHFRNKEYGLRSIKERRLKIARISELNDPFEFLGLNLKDKKIRRALLNTKAKLSEKKGILCFSRNWSNPVQWSHYADHHRGICLGFEIPNHLLAKVKYLNQRIVFKSDIDEEMMVRILTSKFNHWRYEKEYRLFVDLDPDEEQNGFYFSDFSNELKLISVIVGGNADFSRGEIKKALGKDATNVEVFKSRPAFQSFSVVRNRNSRLWT